MIAQRYQKHAALKRKAKEAIARSVSTGDNKLLFVVAKVNCYALPRWIIEQMLNRLTDRWEPDRHRRQF